MLPANVFVFDIETVPDIEGGRRLLDLQDLSDAEVGQAMLALRRQQTGNEFLKLHLHRIVTLSVAARLGDRFLVWSLAEPECTEAEIVSRFFDGIERYTPTLVSWNGSGFDLPVLHYRALLHGITASRYWETGQNDQTFRWNNYTNRYHERHTDVMDILAAYQGRAAAPLDEIATLCGFPGKMGMSGSKVWECVQEGHYDLVRDYCETDVLNTYLVYLRFELMRGNIDRDQYTLEQQRVRDWLQAADKAHLNEFLAAWPEQYW